MRAVVRAFVCASSVLAVLVTLPHAATFNVTIYGDVSDPTPDGVCDSCSLREAIQEANFLPGPDVINLPPGTYNMDIAGADEDLGLTGDLDITDDVTIIGIGTTVIESHVGRILHVLSGNVSITGLTLTQGDANNDPGSGRAGGAVHNASGSTLSLNACTMTINQAQGGGGGIFNAGTLSLNGSTLSANSAAGASRGGAVYNAGTMTITNCTLDGNSSTDGGGAVYTTNGSLLVINNTTINNNASTGGVGGGGLKADAGSTVSMANTIIANNNASGPNDDCEGALTTLGSNLVEDADGCTGLGADDTTGADPILGPLQNNGGRTFTRAPLPGSPALDTGGKAGACEATDQRGLARPQGAACEAGALELFPSCPAIALAPTSLPDAQTAAFYTQTISPSGGAAPYRFAVVNGSLPEGLALDPVSGVLSGVPTKSGTSFTLAAFDANLCTGTQGYSMNVLSGPSCSPTTITLAPTTLPEAIPGTAYTQTLVAAGGTPPHLYTVTDGTLPPGFTLDPNTGTIAGMPDVSGTFPFVATATDASACTGSQGYALQVLCSLTFAPSQLPDAIEGTLYEQTLTIPSGGTAPFAFAVVSGALPPGLSLSGTGALTGTPSTPGTYTFMVEATDANFCTGKLGYIVVVDPCLSILPSVLPNGLVGIPYNTPLSAIGGSGPITFSITSGTLPDGLMIDAAGSITGIPTTPGTSLFTATATDGTCTLDKDYFLVVSPQGCPAMTITPATLPNDTEGNNYNQNVGVTGGTGPYTFQLVDGLLPTGTGLSSGGNLSGTLLAFGSYAFTIVATDANGCTATRSYTVLIVPSVCPALEIFPPSLPDGNRDVPYSQRLIASGGIPPYTLVLTGGALPTGLSFDPVTGTLSGVPTALGAFTFTISVTDAAACTTGVSYTMTILPDLRGANCSLFGDTFEDGVLDPGWTYVKPAWSESVGALIGMSGKKAIAVASPVFQGCLNCSIETTMKISKAGDTRISLLGWYVDKSNMIELSMGAGTDVWMLRQIVKGNVVAKVKASVPTNPNYPYTAKVAFDGAKFLVYVGDLVNPLMTLTPKKPVTAGTVGFQAKGTTGSFLYVCVN